jgi:predicted translin family RNA/ssDNA-binding protein
MINFEHITRLKRQADTMEEKNRQTIDAAAKSIRDFDSRTSEILKTSKKSINEALHDRFDVAEKLLREATTQLKDLYKRRAAFKKSLTWNIQKSETTINSLQNVKADSLDNLFESAAEECLEARLLLKYLIKGNVEMPTEIVFNNLETYVGALCDMCGELLRKSRLEIINGDPALENVGTHYNNTKRIYDTLSSFAFSNKSGLRSKIENLKNYIRDFEKMLYDTAVTRTRP